ncbi:hypothetical protein Bca52824_046319 [Brassica carinata]|uniref:Uncharacterized protein n=1 Tax=Brassica carinata TaxID=52824 RepID=A0A8X7RE91_BRACI|nr:hypothetical protein Bca52824_046319 [Brassica carinata]
MHKYGRYWENMNLEDDEFCYNLAQGDLNKNWEKSSAYFHGGCVARQSFISSVKNPISDGDQEYADLWGGTFGWPPNVFKARLVDGEPDHCSMR